MSTLVPSIRREPGTWLVITAGLVAFLSVAWLGIYYDDFGNIHAYNTQSLAGIARDTHFNRFPLFTLVVYPLLLKMPAGLAHLLIATAHTGVALLLRAVLRGFGYSERVAVGAALLFLLAPAHTEAIHWVVASTIVFGTCVMLASTLALMRGRPVLAVVLALGGMLFSEAIILPSAVLHGLVLLHRRTHLLRTGLHLVAMGASYVAFQLIRFLVSMPGRMAQYEVGLSSAAHNLGDLLIMATGLVSSRDVNWFWNQQPFGVDVGLRLPLAVLLPAMLLMGGAVYVMSRLPGEPLRPRGLYLGLAGTGTGLFAALAVYLLITGNPMQPRYTYVPLVFLVPLLTLVLTMLDRGQVSRAVWMGVMVCMLGWSLYRAWSHVWSNWYPARLVVDRVQKDLDTLARESDVKEFYVVNAPRLVGNAYALMAEWAFVGMGQHLLSRKVWVEDYPRHYRNAPEHKKSGMRFTEKPCLFVGWKNGQRVVETRAFDPSRKLVLDCKTGLVEEPGEGAPPELAYPQRADGAYREMMGDTPSWLVHAIP